MAINEVGTSLLNSISTSGFDPGKMAKTLAEAETASRYASIERKDLKAQSALNAFGYLKENIAAFQTYLADLTNTASFTQKNLTASNPALFTASASESAPAGSYAINVSHLAQSHTLVTEAGYATKSSLVGPGTLSLTYAGTTTDFTTDGQSLEQVRNAINTANIGVNASILYDGSVYKLVYSGRDTGEANTVSVSGTPSSLSGVTQAQAAQNAQLTINGVTISSASNSLTDAVDGVSLSLQATGASQLTVAPNTQSVIDNVTNFVSVFNELESIFDDLSNYSAADDEESFSGDLKGDSTLRSLKAQLQAVMSQVNSQLTGAGVQSLADVGISKNVDGSLSLDAAQLATAVNASPTAVARLFSATGWSADGQIQFHGMSDKTVAGSYAIEITQEATQASLVGAPFSSGSISLPAGARFDVQLDGMASAATIVVNPTGSNMNYHNPEALARYVQDLINANPAVKDSGSTAGVAIVNEGANSSFQFSSSRFGASSSIALSNTFGGADLGFANGSSMNATGQDLTGTLNGVSLGAYVDANDGRKVTVSAFAPGALENLRGLSFSVLGGGTGVREPIVVSRGIAERLNSTINTLVNDSKGLLGSRMSGLERQREDLSAQREKLDARYEKLMLKYQIQFSAVSSLMTQMNATSESLKASFESLLATNK
jgi:flagellar hook-associated protein 2